MKGGILSDCVYTLLFCTLVSCAGGSGPHSPQSIAETDTEGEFRASGSDFAGSKGKGDGSSAVESSETAKRGTADSPEERVPRPRMSGKAAKAFHNGEEAFRLGDLGGAEAQYNAAIRFDQKAYQAHYALGSIYERLGRDDQAQKAYLEALSIVPRHAGSVSAHSLLLARRGREAEAWSFLQASQKNHGASAAIFASMAEVKSLQGESGQAQTLAQESLKLDPGYKPAMVALARDHYRARRIDLALYALKGILDGYGEGNPPRDKTNAEAHLIRGFIYAERGSRGPSMTEMKAAVQQRPDLVDAHLLLANYMMEAGNAKDARRHLEMAIRYDNRNVLAHLQLGDAYRLLGRSEASRKELEWVLAVEPELAAAHYNLGLLFLLGGKQEGVSEAESLRKAISHLEAFKARSGRGGPDDVDDLITRAKTKKALLKANKQDDTRGSEG